MTGARWRRHYVPPQHGAWAMLLIPFAAGTALARPAWPLVPLLAALLVAWVSGYLLSYYALLAVKTRRPGRVAGPLRLYAALAVPSAATVVILAPAVWWWAGPFAVLFAVTVWFARRRDDRALLSGLASAALSCLIIPVELVVAGQPAARGLLPALVVFAYSGGSVLYVKTMIRNRGDGRYQVASAVWHTAAAAALAAVSWPLAAGFGWLAARAVIFPRRGLTPRQVGLAELAHSAVLLIAVPVVFRLAG